MQVIFVFTILSRGYILSTNMFLLTMLIIIGIIYLIMNVTTNHKGQLAVSKTELRSLELGYLPSRPLYDSRYDLIIDTGKKLLRVQVKYADAKTSNSTGSIPVKLAYINRRKKVYTYKDSEIDGLIVYFPKIDKLCFFPTKVFAGKTRIQVRYLESKNNQKKGIILAENYFF